MKKLLLLISLMLSTSLVMSAGEGQAQRGISGDVSDGTQSPLPLLPIKRDVQTLATTATPVQPELTRTVSMTTEQFKDYLETCLSAIRKTEAAAQRATPTAQSASTPGDATQVAQATHLAIFNRMLERQTKKMEEQEAKEAKKAKEKEEKNKPKSIGTRIWNNTKGLLGKAADKAVVIGGTALLTSAIVFVTVGLPTYFFYNQIADKLQSLPTELPKITKEGTKSVLSTVVPAVWNTGKAVVNGIVELGTDYFTPAAQKAQEAAQAAAKASQAASGVTAAKQALQAAAKIVKAGRFARPKSLCLV